MVDSPTGRTRAFVSYSHADEKHLKRLHVHLAPYEREQKMDMWDDTHITPGARWKDEIKRAIASAKVAILLVSADFLASDFIAHDELPPLLEAAEQEGLLIFSIILSRCAFQRSKLARYQALNKPSEPLIKMPRWQQEEIWWKLAEQVADALTPAPIVEAPAPPRSDPPPRPAPSPPPAPVPAPVQVAVAQPPARPSAPPLGTLLLTYTGHKDAVQSLAWSPDGTRIASGGADKTVQVWDAASGQCLLTYTRHAGSIWAIAWSSDGRRLASSSGDKTIQVWDAAIGGTRLVYEGLLTQSGVSALAWSPKDRRLALGCYGGVEVWDDASGQPPVTYTSHARWVYAVAWSPDGTRLASSSDDKTIQVWDAATGQYLFTCKGHLKTVSTISWSPDGRRLASGSWDCTVRGWNAVTGQRLFSTSHKNEVNAVAWSADSPHLASGSWDKTVQVWDVLAGQQPFIYQGHQEAVRAVAWSPDGTRIASASNDGTVQVWSAG